MSVSRDVFTYGSLMFEPVWSEVVSGHYRSEPCEIEGYQRFAIRAEHYPAIVAVAGARVVGRLWRDVEAADLERLDRFEGPEYRRIEVLVRPIAAPDGRPGVSRPAQAYLWLDPARLADAAWDPERFEREHLAGFVRRYRADSGGNRP